MEKIKELLFPMTIVFLVIMLIAVSLVIIGAIWDNTMLMKISGSVTAISFILTIIGAILNSIIY